MKEIETETENVKEIEPETSGNRNFQRNGNEIEENQETIETNTKTKDENIFLCIIFPCSVH